MENYLVAFDSEIASKLTDDEMELIQQVSLMHKNANPHIDHIKWEERDSITALFFDDNNSMLITSYVKAKKIMYGMDPITPAILDWDVFTSINA
ncbi:hypothetical protein [Cytobacillus oceanisediminis]|uniref:hypothetical protein n=1 Tax=Cytobacillus oceanisediminis TaxID=665099 RepID=UPI001FB3BC15|nr:hypothetical protein [Cytobacillus oceanisediminis]UOE57996.1 hypothetical protein IRB79_27395 [Cytobacillus oceanisediminis]